MHKEFCKKRHQNFQAYGLYKSDSQHRGDYEPLNPSNYKSIYADSILNWLIHCVRTGFRGLSVVQRILTYFVSVIPFQWGHISHNIGNMNDATSEIRTRADTNIFPPSSANWPSFLNNTILRCIVVRDELWFRDANWVMNPICTTDEELNKGLINC